MMVRDTPARYGYRVGRAPVVGATDTRRRARCQTGAGAEARDGSAPVGMQWQAWAGMAPPLP